MCPFVLCSTPELYKVSQPFKAGGGMALSCLDVRKQLMGLSLALGLH